MSYWFCEIFQFLGVLGFKSSYMGYLNFESAKKWPEFVYLKKKIVII